MINYKRFLVVCLFCGLILLIFFFIDKKNATSALLGFATGIFNFFLIVTNVKILFGNNKIRSKILKIILTILIYIIKIIAIGLFIYLLIVNRYLINFVYFLIGFTFSLFPVILENLLLIKKEKIKV